MVLTVHREGAEDAMEITVPVTDVELPSVFHEMLDSKIGYIRITQFTGVTGEQYQEAFDDLQKQGMEKMIVDLRDNPGGLLDSVCDILRKILPEGLIVYTEDKDGNREEEKCDGKNELRIPLAVLVNESSASASEILPVQCRIMVSEQSSEQPLTEKAWYSPSASSQTEVPLN